jgi:hypothetical protein
MTSNTLNIYENNSFYIKKALEAMSLQRKSTRAHLRYEPDKYGLFSDRYGLFETQQWLDQPDDVYDVYMSVVSPNVTNYQSCYTVIVHK